jgi:uncharacterized protein
MTKKTFSQALEFIETNVKNQPISISFFGTEPLVSVHKLKKFITRIKKKHPDWKVGLTTNGTLITPDIARFFKYYDVNVLLSCDGLPQAHNQFRQYPNGMGSWKNVMAGLTTLQAYDVPFGIALSVVPQNVKYLYKSILMFYKLNVKFVALNKVVDFGHYDWNELYLMLTKIAEWYIDHTEQLRVEFLQKTFDYMEKNGNSPQSRYTCGACQQSFAINFDGTISICHAVINRPEFQIGTLEDGIDYERFMMYHGAEVTKCFECPVVPCSTCYYRSLDHTGSLTEPNPIACQYEAIRYRVAKDWYPQYLEKKKFREALKEVIEKNQKEVKEVFKYPTKETKSCCCTSCQTFCQINKQIPEKEMALH